MDGTTITSLGCLEDVYVVMGDKKNVGLKHFFKVTDQSLRNTLNGLLSIPTKPRARRGQKISYISPDAMISQVAFHSHINDILPIFQKLIRLLDKKKNDSIEQAGERDLRPRRSKRTRISPDEDENEKEKGLYHAETLNMENDRKNDEDGEVFTDEDTPMRPNSKLSYTTCNENTTTQGQKTNNFEFDVKLINDAVVYVDDLYPQVKNPRRNPPLNSEEKNKAYGMKIIRVSL